ncbi:MAG: hypothetical protein K6U03_04215 [Firmicutes bacterium]|nr:hypothetical protein [Bacillota bacterium]
MSIGFLDIKPCYKKLLDSACDILIDTFHEDLDILMDGKDWDETWMSQFLPKKFRIQYDLCFAKRFLDTLLVVIWKLNDDDCWTLNSVAEEMAMAAIIKQAESLAEQKDIGFDSNYLYDGLFEDVDFELLFEPEMDGIEDDKVINRIMRYANLCFEDWFKPFRGTDCRI